ncbi:MAG: O-antigen ligase family protein [Sphingomonas sp.]|nr:O-antigen ligase family protein [Sphingomonas sp.]
MFFLACLLAGGGGAHQPVTGAILEISAAGLIAALISARLLGRAQFNVPPASLLVLFGGIVLLVAAQLIPLPFNIWSALPGRTFEASALDAAGLSRMSMPISLLPWATMQCALALLPAAAVVLVAVRRSQSWVGLALAVVIAGAVSALLQCLQMVGIGWVAPWRLAQADTPAGLFINSNHQVDLLAAAMLFAGCICREVRRGGFPTIDRQIRRFALPGAAAFVLFLSAMIVASGSRAALAFVVPAAILAISVAASWDRLFRLTLIALVLLAPVMIAVFYGSVDLPSFRSAAGLDHETRIQSIGDLFYTLSTYFPAGSGFGTFDVVFRHAESLDLVTDTYLNHAHNDYLEILIEGGVIGGVVVIYALSIIIFYAIKKERLKFTTRQDNLGRASAAALLFLALHSIVDYPIRNYSISAMTALLLVMLCSRSKEAEDRREMHKR